MFAGFLCTISDEPVTPEACLICALQGGGRRGATLCPFTPPLVRGLIESNQPRGLEGYSATELSGCPRAVVLKASVDYWLKPGNAYWAFRGQLAHALLERAGADGAVCEQRFFARMGETVISGQPDVVYPDPGRLVDYKTTREVPASRLRYTCACGRILRESPWRVRKGATLDCPECGAVYAPDDLTPQELPPAPYPGHVQQVNVYRWLLAQNGIAIECAEVLYLDMARPLRLPAPLWDLAETESVIETALYRLAETGPDGYPYGVQDDAEANWECRYCPVNAQCRQLQEANGHTEMEDAGLIEINKMDR